MPILLRKTRLGYSGSGEEEEGKKPDYPIASSDNRGVTSLL